MLLITVVKQRRETVTKVTSEEGILASHGRGMVTGVTPINFPAARDTLVTTSKCPANGNQCYQWIKNGGETGNPAPTYQVLHTRPPLLNMCYVRVSDILVVMY